MKLTHNSEEKESNTKPLKGPVLIVDDNPQYGALLHKMLSGGFGYQDVTLVDNIGQAWELVESDRERFKVIFVDYNFPDGHTGGEFLRKLQGENILHDKVAFLITSEPTVENQKEALAAGAKGVVAKPFDRTALQNQLAKALRALALDAGESF